MATIDRVLDTLRLPLDAAARERLDGYVALLMEANAQFNLTAIKDPELIEANLVGGSLELLTLLPDSATSLIDIGSGGGVPGLIIAAARPELTVCLVDSTGKKVRFLEETAGILGLANVTAVHGRAEDLAQDATYREQFDVGTARAVARLATLVELVLPFVTPGGVGVFPKGTGALDELEEALQAIGFVGGRRPEAIPSKLDESTYIAIEKARETPARFPRRVGIPGKRPIGVPVG